MIRKRGLGLRPVASPTRATFTQRHCYPTTKCSPREDLTAPSTLSRAGNSSLANARFEDTATLLPSGKVLAAGGLGQERGTNRASARSDSDGPAPSADSSFKRHTSAEPYDT